MRAKPTLEDVARRAQVSTATVSRCLNAPDKVVETTRKRVLQAVRDLGYAPDFGARVMAARRTNTIGAVIPTMENAIFARALQSFQERLHQSGYQLLVASSSYRMELEDEQVRALVARGAEGLLLIGHDRLPATTSFLARQGVPTLVAWAEGPNPAHPAVGFDNHRAMKELTAKALMLGHRRIAMISAHMAHNDRARARVEGVRAALVDAGLSEDDLSLIETDYGIEQGASAFNRLWAGSTRPTLIICGNDVLAVGGIRQARKIGVNVPRDVSITGFDDIEIATLIEPELTTVEVPHRAIGEASAEILIKMVEGDQWDPAALSISLPTRLIMRDSLAAPRQDAT